MDMSIIDDWFDALLKRNVRFRRLQANMSAVAEYASQINDISNQNADDIASVASELEALKGQVANSDAEAAAAFDPIISKLRANSDALSALANPSNPDNPAPLPDEGGSVS